MNIELQCASLFVMIILSILFIREKKIDLTNRKLFSRVLVTCGISILFDILSVICINYSTITGEYDLITKLVCKLYIISLVLQGYLGYVYVMTEIFIHKKYKLIKSILHWIFFIGECLILITPIYYTCENNQVYSYGISTIIAYILAIIFITTIVVIGLVWKANISHKRFATIMTWQGIWFVCAIIQCLLPDLLIISFASSLGVIVLYTQLENPSLYIDTETNAFTKEGLLLYVQDAFKYSKVFSAFTVKINYKTKFVDVDVENNIKFKVAQLLIGLNKGLVFKLNDDMFCVMYKDSYHAREYLENTMKLSSKLSNIPMELSYIFIPTSSEFFNPDEFFKFISTNEDTIIIEGYLEASYDVLSEFRKYNRISYMIDNALEEDRVEVFYQPFYNTKAKKFTSAEALVRIKNIDGTYIPPGQFIPIAEETGQIIPLGIRIFDKVCQFIANNKPQQYGLENIEVNLSAAQFDYENPVKFIKEHLSKYEIDPNMINLEITETAHNKNSNTLMENINTLRKIGITFSLDDFGTGRSNLDYFVNFPVQNIKFDYLFTQGYFTNEKIKYVLEGMANIFHNMGMKIVSEGIETKEQLDAMIKLQVDFIQGFYFSKPIPENEFLKFIQNKNAESEEII